MKLVKYIILFFLLANTCHGQLEQKTWLVGGSGYFNTFKRETTSFVSPDRGGYSNNLALNISPNFGYFVADKFAVGLRPYFSWGKGEYFPDDPTQSGSTGNSRRYGIGPFARYYFLDREKQFNILTDISYQLGVWDEAEKGRLSNFSFLAGPVVYFNSSVGMELLLGFSRESEELKNFSKNTSNGFYVNIGFQIHLIK